jgi:hypothetical protein
MAYSLTDYAINDLSNYKGRAPAPVMGPVQPAAQGPVQPAVTGVTKPPATREQTIADIDTQAQKLQGDVNNFTEPTVGQALFNAPGAETYGDPLIEQYYKEKANTVVDEKAINRAQLKLFQREIDATNKVYDQMLRSAQMEGQGRLGSQGAMNARAGILGSDFSAAHENEVRGYNRGIEGGIQAERSAKIGAIMGTARKAAADEIAEKNKAKKEGAESYLTYLGNKSTRKNENRKKLAQALYDQEVDPSSMDKAELDEIAKQYGVTTADVISDYSSYKTEADASASKADLEKRKTESEIAKNGRVELSEGAALVDPATGKVIYKNPKTYEPKEGGGDVSLNGSTAFVGQANYSKLTVKQKNQADSLNNLIREMNNYKTYYDKNRGAFGGKAGNLFGADSGQIETMLNGIIFAAAQAEGTGALQKPDREVIEKMVPNPSSIGGAWNTLRKGGADANINRIQNQIEKYTNNLAGYGLSPILNDVAGGSESNDTEISKAVDSAGYDYAAMKADGLSDEEIISAINGG